MALWDRWFGPKCDLCGARLERDRHVLDGRKLCPSCNEVATTRTVEPADVPAPTASAARTAEGR